jgi:hypothetical protein
MSEFVLTMPRRGRGRPSPTANQKYQAELCQFCEALREIESTVEFKVSSRGWCYILEEHGLGKGDFDRAQRIINDARKAGLLPINFCCEDEGRQAENLEKIDDQTPAEFAHGWIDYLSEAHEQYCPISFWDDLDIFVQMTVEKIDLKTLFNPVCKRFHVPLSNVSGWNDINEHAEIMRRFAEWEECGKRIVLLHCGDHDPGGLRISDFIRSNMADIKSVGWSPDNLHIERFGLNADFIRRNRLTWIDNLETGSGGDLADPNHDDHKKSYVQDYLREFGARKCEANALVVRPDAGRKLCRDAILKYVPANAVERYERRLTLEQRKAQQAIKRLLNGGRS